MISSFMCNRLSCLLLFVFLISPCFDSFLIGQVLTLNNINSDEVSNYYPLEVYISFEEAGVATLNYKGPLGSTDISFFNTEKPRNILTKTVSTRSSQNQHVTVLSINKSGSSFKFHTRVYFLGHQVDNLILQFREGELLFADFEGRSDHDELIDAYFNSDLGTEIRRLKNNEHSRDYSASLKNELDSVYSKYSLMYPDNTSRLGMVNELSYLSRLQIIEPTSIKIEAFIKRSNSELILDDTFSGLFSGYVNNRITSFSFDQLNRTNYTVNSLYRIAQEIYKYLIEPENLISLRREEALSWLRTTLFYQNYSMEIEESIEYAEGKELAFFLKNLSVSDEFFNGHSLKDIVMSNPSDYYLLDFWATWCAPCLQGFEEIKKIQLPKNLTLISLSVDKYENKEKWKSKANEIGLSNSYLINPAKNSAYFELFQLAAIPRYMVLDKKLNVINIDMFQPHEPQFLEYLNSLNKSY